MSTKCTIGYNEDFHLYEECFDNDKVYLELNGDKHEVELEYSQSNKSCTVSIDVTLWREIINAWTQSSWGKNPSLDHKQQEVNLEYLNDLIEISLRNKAKKELQKRDGKNE